VRVRVCSEQQRLHCAKLEQCFPGSLRIDYASLADCQARAPAACTGEPAIPSSPVTEAMLDGCIAAQTALSCSDYFNNTPVPACQFMGPKALGASCFTSEQCASGNCTVIGNALCGHCTAFLALGAVCATGGRCGPGLFCNGRVCIALAAAGADCDPTNKLCGYGLYCAAGKCTPQVAMAGAPCTPAVRQNDPSSCSDAMNLICDATTQKCVAKTYTALGQMCSRSTPRCEGGTGCLITVMGGGTGTCVSFQQPGQQCDRNRPCAEPYFCYSADPNAQSGTCVLGDVPDPAVCE
jgi:hypothetical protein